MKAQELADLLMQNPDADVRVILLANWHIELEIEKAEWIKNNMVLSTVFPQDISDAFISRQGKKW